jgi:hypothetical protein
MGTAYMTRASSLDQAWTMVDTSTRRTAVKSAWSTWKSSSSGARSIRETARTAAWAVFDADTTVCRVNPVDLDTTQ